MDLKEIGKDRGITLVALVITIIVLLILAGITIVILTGDNGIIKKAEEASNKTNVAVKEENNRLSDLEEAINTIETDIGKEKELEKTEETNPYFPNSNFTQVKESSLDTGLVVTDGTNEYVWIETPRSITASATNTTEIETALKNYATSYRAGAYTDTWQIGNGITDANEYNTLKDKMLTSIKTYGGFWIGRYEMGTADNSIRTSNTATTANAVSAQARYPYNFITLSQAQELAYRNSTGEYTCSILFGIQWDLTCKYLETKGISKSLLLTDSSSIGNFQNVSFTVTRGEYSTNNGTSYTKVTTSYTRAGNAYVLFTTGASERNKTFNIYDFAGNQYESTLEKPSGNMCTVRSGDYRSYGYNYRVASRYNIGIATVASNVSSRITLYR